MYSNTSSGWLHFRIDPPQCLWILLAIYLLIDTLGGFFYQQLGLSLRISQVFKLAVIGLCFYNLLRWQSVFSAWLVAIFVVLLFGPLYRLMTGHSDTFLQFDLAFTLRLVMFFCVLFFCIECAKKSPELFITWAQRSLVWGFWIVAINVLIGFAGIGFHTYPHSKIGFKGFFIAGNEVSAVFVLLTAFMTQRVWVSRSKIVYLMFSALVLVIGLAIATKAGILFAFAVIILTPVLNLRAALFSAKAAVLLACLSILLVIITFQAFEWLETLPIYVQLERVFNERGIWGFLLSGRDVFLVVFWQSIQDIRGISVILFGDGGLSFAANANKETAEVDPVDIMMYFGAPLTLVLLVLSLFSIASPLKRLSSHYYAPAILLANAALFGFAIIAGHVWTSGMLGIAWAIMNSLLLIRIPQNTVVNTHDLRC